MTKILNPLELRSILKEKKNYNYRTFIVLNSHNIEKYVRKIILNQLKKSVVNWSYNSKFDLLLYFRNRKFSIEVKSCKRFIYNKSNGYNNNGNFKFSNKIFYNRPNIVVFCIYHNQYRKVLFCYGKDVISYLNKRKRKKGYYNISIKQLYSNLKPKIYISEIIDKVFIYG